MFFHPCHSNILICLCLSAAVKIWVQKSVKISSFQINYDLKTFKTTLFCCEAVKNSSNQKAQHFSTFRPFLSTLWVDLKSGFTGLWSANATVSPIIPPASHAGITLQPTFFLPLKHSSAIQCEVIGILRFLRFSTRILNIVVCADLSIWTLNCFLHPHKLHQLLIDRFVIIWSPSSRSSFRAAADEPWRRRRWHAVPRGHLTPQSGRSSLSSRRP